MEVRRDFRRFDENLPEVRGHAGERILITHRLTRLTRRVSNENVRNLIWEFTGQGRVDFGIVLPGIAHQNEPALRKFFEERFDRVEFELLGRFEQIERGMIFDPKRLEMKRAIRETVRV